MPLGQRSGAQEPVNAKDGRQKSRVPGGTARSALPQGIAPEVEHIREEFMQSAWAWCCGPKTGEELPCSSEGLSSRLPACRTARAKPQALWAYTSSLPHPLPLQPRSGAPSPPCKSLCYFTSRRFSLAAPRAGRPSPARPGSRRLVLADSAPAGSFPVRSSPPPSPFPFASGVPTAPAGPGHQASPSRHTSADVQPSPVACSFWGSVPP